MPLIASLVLLLGQNNDPVKLWQVKYESLINTMKQKETRKVLALFHKDYSETSDGIVLGLAQVKKHLPARMDTIAKYGQKPIVRGVKAVGYTATVTVDMSYKAVRKEKGKTNTLFSRSRLIDTWVKVGKDFQLFRSVLVSTETTLNGKPVKPPTKSQ